MKRIGKLALAAVLVTGLGVQAYAVSVGSSSVNLLDMATFSVEDTEVEPTQLVFSLDEIQAEKQLEPAPESILEVGSISEPQIQRGEEQLVQSANSNIISDTVISETYVPAPSAGYAPATYSSGGGFASSGGGFSGGGAGGGLAGGGGLGLGAIGAAVAIPVAVSSDDDDDVVAYPAP